MLIFVKLQKYRIAGYSLLLHFTCLLSVKFIFLSCEQNL